MAGKNGICQNFDLEILHFISFFLQYSDGDLHNDNIRTRFLRLTYLFHRGRL